jgi:hypothetical protein
MIDSDEQIRKFLVALQNHARQKRKLYDGADRVQPGKQDIWLRYAIEELGEVAAAISRDRLELAKAECIDLAHCAMLLYLVLDE